MCVYKVSEQLFQVRSKLAPDLPQDEDGDKDGNGDINDGRISEMVASAIALSHAEAISMLNPLREKTMLRMVLTSWYDAAHTTEAAEIEFHAPLKVVITSDRRQHQH